MDEHDYMKDFDEQQQSAYEKEAARRWGEDVVSESSRRWASYTPLQKNTILAENHAVTQGVADNMEKGARSPEVQYWIDRWYKAINTYFYTCSLEVFEALGRGYVEDPAFTAVYESVKVGLADFMRQAMAYYCQVQRGSAGED